MKVIIPCAGRSSRYPNMPPKWMLPAHDGRPMVHLAIEGLGVNPSDVVITILREHDERFGAVRGLQEVFGGKATIVVLPEQTQSQSETVAETIQRIGLHQPFLVKDSDNVFNLNPVEASYNYVSVSSLNNFDMINPRNKSYVSIDHENDIVNIREKQVISDLFSVGGYYFRDPLYFLEVFARLKANAVPAKAGELYLSEVIAWMIMNGTPFRARQVSDYRDWGTVLEWQRQLDSSQTYFVALDGLVFERGSTFFSPKFEDAKPVASSVAAVRKMVAGGHKVIYLSIRPKSLAELTNRQLREADAPYGEVIYDCPVSRWTLLTAPHSTLPFRTSAAMELHPDDPMFEEKLEL